MCSWSTRGIVATCSSLEVGTARRLLDDPCLLASGEPGPPAGLYDPRRTALSVKGARGRVAERSLMELSRSGRIAPVSSPVTRPRPPFHAEHIGSLLRPPALLAARQATAEGQLSAEGLRVEEDRHIRDAIRLQEDLGLEVVTDGEYRRGIFFGHFGAAVSGFTEMEAEMSFRDAGGAPMRYRAAVVTGRLVRQRGIATDEFRFVREITRR